MLGFTAGFKQNSTLVRITVGLS